MKRLLLIFVLLVFGCAGMQPLEDNATNQVLGYASGKGVGITFGVSVKKGIITQVTEDRLNELWDNMMESNAGADPVAPEELIKFFNRFASLVINSMNSFCFC